jgi:4-hydroxy-tetrahydrodipicolinate reductase
MDRLSAVQIGLGPIGREIANLIRGDDRLELAGAADPAAGLKGRDLGAVLGSDPLGIEVVGDAVTLAGEVGPALAFHAVGSYLEEEADLLRAILERGVSVVSTCEELSYPFYSHPDLSRDLDRVAAGSGCVLLGTGVNPGFVLDKLVATLGTACARVDHVRASRVVDAASRRGPLQRKVGAGLSVEEFEARLRAGRFGHVGLTESAHMVADAVGVRTRRSVSEVIRPKVAPHPVRTEHVQVEVGQAAGVSQVVVVEEERRERVRLELEMYVGAQEPADTISIRGEPPVEMTIPGGIPGDQATASIAVNCGLRVKDLRPGLRTMLDV